MNTALFLALLNAISTCRYFGNILVKSDTQPSSTTSIKLGQIPY